MDTGKVVDVCVSTAMGTPKIAVTEAVLRAGHGVEGDAHAGSGHRQVSLLADEDIGTMRARGLALEAGAFGENLVLSGVDLAALGVGSRLAVGDAELRISQIGKVCHDRCAIYVTTGDCIMPRQGLFAEVLQGGVVARDCTVRILERRPRIPTLATEVSARPPSRGTASPRARR